ncbi:MAG TPA: NAD-dependent epimerase/dehydratase family protein [Gemmatimonadaceae bacterium]|nr:NAD-dependent epimerase/dehydratase family protein [Gemmatimonadaceae bacterium]
MSKHALVTGGAGFIGSHVVDRLLEEGWAVTTLDSFDDFYDPAAKRRNVAAHRDYARYTLVEADLRDADALAERLTGEYDAVVHLAARAGVRPSIERPLLYQEVNVRGTHNLLELCRHRGVRQFVFASSSSVYGVNPDVPWREDSATLMPISPYASTKVSGELLGHVYSHLFGIRFVALRFFTVYGPRQRPDLAIHKFARLMMRGEPIPFYGDGGARRDYTYVADTVSGILAALRYDALPYEIINLGNDNAISLLELVRALEDVLGVRAQLQRLPDQPGDVPQTWASVEKARRLLGYAPATKLRDGLHAFASWLDLTARLGAGAAPVGDIAALARPRTEVTS